MKKKAIPVNIYDTVAIAHWLSQMALEEGLILETFFGRRAAFAEGSSQRIAYRLIPTEGDEYEKPSSEITDAFLAQGWHFVAMLDKFFVFQNTDENPKPIPFSREEERRIFEIYSEKEKKDLRNHLLFLLLIVGFEVAILWLSLHRVILGYGGEQWVGPLLLAFTGYINSMRTYRSVKIIRHKLDLQAWEEEGPYMLDTKGVNMERIVSVLLILLCFLPLLHIFETENNRMPLVQAEVSLPYIPLDSIMEGRAADGEVIFTSSLLAPVQYEIEQFLYPERGSNWMEYMTIQYAQTRGGYLAERLLHGMLRSDTDNAKKWTSEDKISVRQLDIADVDEAWILSSDLDCKVYLRKENRFLQVRGIDEVYLQPHFQELAKLLEQPYTARWDRKAKLAVE